jgi:glycosyltransferase involved in cell wall biosynthesis
MSDQGFLEPGARNHAPAVSVVVPVYRARYLRSAIASVEAQTYGDYEIIVVDDGSPDRVTVDAWSAADRDRVRCLKQENRGPSGARNTGILAARGSFVAFLDSDDTWEPTYLKEQIAAITRGEGFDLVFSNWMTMGRSRPRRYGPVSCTGLLREECTIILSGVVARRDAVLDAGLFDERFRHAEDFDLWLRMLKTGARIVFQPRALLNRRVHAASLSYDTVHHGGKALLVLEKFQQRSDLTTAERAAGEWRIRKLAAEIRLEEAKRAMARGDFTAARAALHDANEFYRSWKLRLVRLLFRLWPTLVVRGHDLRERLRSGRSHATAERR